MQQTVCHFRWKERFTRRASSTSRIFTTATSGRHR